MTFVPAEANMILRRKLGRRIRAARKARRLTQPALAGLAEMHVSHISKIERGEANVTLSSLLAITAPLEMDPCALFQEIRLADLSD